MALSVISTSSRSALIQGGSLFGGYRLQCLFRDLAIVNILNLRYHIQERAAGILHQGGGQ